MSKQRIKELSIIDNIERQLHQLALTCERENMVKSLIDQVQFLGQLYFAENKNINIKDSDYQKATAKRILFTLEGGRKLSSYDIGEEIYPYIKHFKGMGLRGIKSEKRYVSKAKKSVTYYFLER